MKTLEVTHINGLEKEKEERIGGKEKEMRGERIGERVGRSGIERKKGQKDRARRDLRALGVFSK